MIVLRDYQQRFVDELGRAVAGGTRRVIGVAPTGSGKGSVAASLLAGCWRKGKRALFVVHRREIIKDVFNRVASIIGEEHVGVILAGDSRRRPGARVQIASVDSLRSKTLPEADLVIIDEAHRSHAASYVALIKHYTHAVVVGLTATPLRLDRKGLGDLYEAMIVFAKPSELIKAGWIVQPRVFSVPSELLPDLSAVRSTAGDFNQKDLEQAVMKRVLVGSIVEHWLQRAEGRMTVVFAVSVAHSRQIVEQFVERGIPAEHVDGGMPTAKREEVIERFRKREFPVLVQCQLLVEGVDIPDIKCVVLARPTQSLTIYLQSCGRAIRPSGDVSMLVLDHAGNARRFGRPDDDREWSLNPTRKRKKEKDETSVKTCEACFAVLPTSARVCLECGFQFGDQEVKRGELGQVEGQLEEMMPETLEGKQLAFWNRQCEIALERGHNPWWAVMRYREKFGENPPEHFKFPERPQYSENEKILDWSRLRRIAATKGLGRDWAEKKYRNKFGEEPPQPIGAAPRQLPPAPAETRVEPVPEDATWNTFEL